MKPDIDAMAAILPMPHARLGVNTEDGRITGLTLLPEEIPERASEQPTVVALAAQLKAYLATPDSRFDIELEPTGTEFQHRVWQRLRTIRPGRPLTYGELARELGSGARAVGNACHANPFPIVVPCHRVVGSNGEGGFAGSTGGWQMRLKHWLLAHERAGLDGPGESGVR